MIDWNADYADDAPLQSDKNSLIFFIYRHNSVLIITEKLPFFGIKILRGLFINQKALNLYKNKRNMTKIMTIEINENDENVLLEIFKKFKVKIKNTYLTDDQQIIRENLRQKYVVTGEWDTMSLDEKEDAAIFEDILLSDASKTVNTEDFLTKLKNR